MLNGNTRFNYETFAEAEDGCRFNDRDLQFTRVPGGVVVATFIIDSDKVSTSFIPISEIIKDQEYRCQLQQAEDDRTLDWLEDHKPTTETRPAS